MVFAFGSVRSTRSALPMLPLVRGTAASGGRRPAVPRFWNLFRHSGLARMPAAAVNPGDTGGHNLPATNLEHLASRLWTVVHVLGIRRGHRGATRVSMATRRG